MWTLENYISILENTTTSPIMRWLANTIVVTVTGTVLVVAVDCFAAYALARLDLPFKKKGDCVFNLGYDHSGNCDNISGLLFISGIGSGQ